MFLARFIYLIVCRVSVQFAGRLVSRLFQHFLGLLLATGEEAQGTLPSPPSTLHVEARKSPEVRTIVTYHIIVLTSYCLISSFHLFVFRKYTTQNYIAYNTKLVPAYPPNFQERYNHINLQFYNL